MKKQPASAQTHDLSGYKLQAGFTLLEVVVATAITVIMMIAASGLFLATLRTNTKDSQVTAIKTDGDYAISQIEFLLRNAVSVIPDPLSPTSPSCVNGMSSITFKEVDGGITTLSSSNGLIASRSAVQASPAYLTTPSTTLSGLQFDCSQAGTNYGTYVTVSFSLDKDEANSNQPNTLTQQFQTSVNVRSY
ncbi:hypothetical protein BH10PAT2_BH10PAT2_2170 [soil metagenome]